MSRHRHLWLIGPLLFLTSLLLAPNAMANWRIIHLDEEMADMRFSRFQEAYNFIVDQRAAEEVGRGTFAGSYYHPSYQEGRYVVRMCFRYLNPPEDADDTNVKNCEGSHVLYWREDVILAVDMEQSPDLERDQGEPITELCVGNPIHVATGNKFQSELDYSSAGAEPLIFERFYNSQSSASAGLGHWRHTYASSIEASEDAEAVMMVVNRPRGQRLAFYRGDEQWVPTWNTEVRLEEINGEYTPGSTYQDQETGEMVSEPPSITNDGWRLVLPDGEIEIYDTEGRLQAIERPSGNVFTLSYLNGELQEVSDAYGRQLSFQWSNGQITGMEDPAGGLTQYQYDGDTLTGVTYPDGATRGFIHDDPRDGSLLTGLVDERGNRFATWAYDDQGRAVLSEHAGGTERTTISYTGEHQATVTNALGHEQHYTFGLHNGQLKPETIEGAPCTGFEGGVRTFEYGADGMVDRITDREGQPRTFVHNNRGLEARRTSDDGGVIVTDWHPEVAKPATITEPERVTERGYDSRYRLTSRIVSERYGEGERTWTYTYYPDSNGVPGQLATVDGPRTDVSDVTSFAYDAQGNLDTITNPLGHETRLQDHDAHGRPHTVVDANGVTWTLAYDDRGRLERMTGPTGTFGFTFNDAGLLVEESLPNGQTLTLEYDAAQRLVATVDALGNRQERELNALGDPEVSRLLNGQGTVKWQESRTYGENGWLLAITNALGQTTSLSYDRVANLAGTEDPAGDAYQYEYDGFHHRTRVTDPLGEVAQARYEDTGDITQVTDFGGERTYNTFNGFGEPTRINSPDSGITDYTYDEAGNLATRTDALGQVTTYEQDALNRLTRIRTDDPDEADVVIRYDEPGAENGIGRLTTVIDGAGETTFDYTASGELKRVERTSNGDTYSLAYTYDGAGQIETITYPSGRVVTYERDAAGEVATVTTTAPDGTETVLASQIEHALFGPITSLTHGNGLTETRTLDQAYQVASVTVPGVLARDYAYTVDDNVAGIDDLLSSARTQAFGYDPVDRLTAADGAYGDLGFEYDANANRKALIEDGQRDDYRLDTSSNWLLEAGARDYRYDNAGNTLERGSDTFAYDTHHRLTEATVDGTTATYAYNVQHQRVSKTVGGTTTRFFYGQGGELLSEMVVGTGLTAAEYVWLDGKPLAYITNGQVYQVHTDHLGTPQVLTDATSAIAWEAEYRPFGEAVTTGSVSFPLRFPGQYHDTETGLHYNWHRYYDPATGRYLTSDPIGLEGGLNPYAYASANPLVATDPTGLAVETAWDIANIALGLSQTVSDIREGEYRAALVSGGATGVDILAAAVPFVPGGASTTVKASRCAENAATRPLLRGKFAGEEIAGGHAFDKHVLQQGEFRGLGIRTRAQFAKHVESVINNPSASRQLSSGRTAYWDDASSTVVIRNPRAIDGGTAFQPISGRAYFDRLR